MIILEEDRLLHFKLSEKFLFPKLDVIKMTDLFRIIFLYLKGTIAKKLNESNCGFKHSVTNSSVINNSFKFDRCSAGAPQKNINNHNKQQTT